VLSVQNLQKKRYFHKNEHDEIHKYDEMLNQDNDNQDKMSYILRTQMEKNGNLICKHVMSAKRKNKDTQKYAENYNQKCDKKNTHTEIYFGEQEYACD
jgi:hypothetical protein